MADCPGVRLGPASVPAGWRFGVNALALVAGARAAALALALAAAALNVQAANGGWTVAGWNNLGMHCMDSDYSVMSILPPFNTLHAQLMDPAGNLITAESGYIVTFEAVADASGSINTTSIGKSNFWEFGQSLFGLPAPLAPDTGLTGVMMPGVANTPRPMVYDAANGWWVAEGIPVTPHDDSGAVNAYPLFCIKVTTAGGAPLASTNVVLPVSDEMSCKGCHASDSGPAARPVAGWVNDPNPERDYRLNAVRLHDDRHNASPGYSALLVQFGYNAGGLYATVTTDGKPILCASCHASNALGTAGAPGVSPLTTAMHALHAEVVDPASGLSLDDTTNRSACYSCHPGSTTKCLRGAMGTAVAADGSMAIQCQDCHGGMSAVGAADRIGWLDEPTCQNCHTGTAIHNNGEIRYTSVFGPDGQRRIAVDQTFATTPNAPAPGISLYRFSTGHGGLKCELCHGSTHAEFPSSHRNDNVQSIALQGHSGVLAECSSCHSAGLDTVTGGPHGMHPVGQGWISGHADAAEGGGGEACRVCHGADYRGSVLSYSKDDRTLNTGFGAIHFWRGFRIGCYNCHRGPTSDDVNPNHPAVVHDAASASSGLPVSIPLIASDADGDPLILRVVSQPAHGTAGLAGTTATYYPDRDYQGSDSFTFAAWDGDTDSNLATVVVVTTPGSVFADGFESR